jgi:hypothetical protein
VPIFWHRLSVAYKVWAARTFASQLSVLQQLVCDLSIL